MTLTLHNRLKLIRKIVTTYYHKTVHCRSNKTWTCNDKRSNICKIKR